MEKGIDISWEDNLTKDIWNNLGLEPSNPGQMSPLVLAFIGDSIYDLVVKTYVVSQGNMPVNKMNKKSSSLVKAEAQSRIVGFLEEQFNAEEAAVFRRGRNAKSYTSAKNASILDYRRATGLEALMGYLYLSGKYERMTQLIKEGITYLESENQSR